METKAKRGLSGAVLKWIAVVTMFIDHAAVVLIEGSWTAGIRAVSYSQYLFLRGVGRLAFPIYCFLLVEGFLHTRDIRRYLLRLLVFGLISELPFNLAFRSSLFSTSYQNVYFTLFLGLLAVWAYAQVVKKLPAPRWAGVLLGLLAAAPWVVAAELLNTDYGLWGSGLILVMYLLRHFPLWRDLSSALVLYQSSPLEVVGYLDFLLFHFYNGQRGRQPKYFFYLFYPCHLLLLVGLRRLIFGL